MTVIVAVWLALGAIVSSAEQSGLVGEVISSVELRDLSEQLERVQSDTLFRFTPVPSELFKEGVPRTTLPYTLDRNNLRWVGETAEMVEKARPDTVFIWEYANRPGFAVSETDSTLRWVQLLNLFDSYYERPGVITYRTGLAGRKDALDMHAYDTGDMSTELEGLMMNSVLTGQVNWNRMTVHKIQEVEESDFSGRYRSSIRLRDHYLVQPRTYLNFDESKHDYRSLEFSYTQNLRNTTNLELSFWDRRDGIGYRRHKMTGSQILARVYHQLNESWLLRGALITNSRDSEEPFGYTFADPTQFTFNRFTATPIESSASSESGYGDLYLQAHYRSDRDSRVSTIFGIHRQVESWSMRSQADTVSVDFRRYELYANQRYELGTIELQGDSRVMAITEKEGVNLSKTRWFGSEMSLSAVTPVTRWFDLSLFSSASFFNDSRNSTELSGRLQFHLSEQSTIALFAGEMLSAPDIQASYWQSALNSGDSELNRQQTLFAGTSGEFRINPSLPAGFRTDIRQRIDQIFINSEGVFTSADPYTVYSASGWVGLDRSRFEGMISATYSAYYSDSELEINRILDGAGDRVWLKGSFYWKNYLFDRATFVKAGVSGHFSPNPFRTAGYHVPLNRWQHAGNEWINPSYYRVDLNISARVRWMMVLLKWENLFDGAGQIGYFETTGYPMSERRFRFAIRVLFTN